MNLKRVILALATLLSVVSCRRLPLNIGGDKIVASVDDKELRVSGLEGVIPKGLSADDSLLFVAKYAEKWIQNNVKLLEAERKYASSAPDIDKMVEEYRNSLMIRKLEKDYINEKFRPTLSDDEIEEYYRKHGDNFLLATHIVKGVIVTLPKDAKDAKELLKQMSTYADKRGGDFRSICEKKGYALEELNTSWVDYTDFLSRLPIVHRGNMSGHVTRQGVQQLEDANNLYYFLITDVMGVGDVEPLERVKDKIIYILNNRNQSEFLRQYDQELLREANLREAVHNYTIVEE